MNTTIKNLRKIIPALMITILSGGIALAQPGEGRQGPPKLPSDKQIEKMVKELDKELELSEEQGTEVSELYFAHFEKVETKMESSQRPSRTEMEALDNNLEKDVKAVLSKDQQKQYSAWLKEQEKQRSSQRPQEGQHGGQGPPR